MHRFSTGARGAWTRIVPTLGLALAATALTATGARADEIRVKGDTLHGTITRLEGSKIHFDTGYGGKLKISLADVEAISTDRSFYVFHRDEDESIGRLVGVEDGALLVGEDPALAERIPLADIHSGWSAEAIEGSAWGRLRSRLRFWNANLDLGFTYTQSTTDTLALGFAAHAERKKAPTRFVFDGSYRYGTTDKKSSGKEVTDNQLKGRVKGEYTITDGLFAWASVDAEHNPINSLALRVVPQAGLGYKIYDSDTTTFQVEGGGAWVHERFFGRLADDSFNVVFAAELNSKLPYDAKFHARVEYLPAVDDWVGDYLVRSEAWLALPLIDIVSFKVTVHDDYDNTPAQDADRNSFTTLVGLSVSFDGG
ncbi:MAG: DUF481 domain-containing protein [Myxococcales bacterium]|nr:DUF481 domain-containing protein [Myxococcales bacterium]